MPQWVHGASPVLTGESASMGPSTQRCPCAGGASLAKPWSKAQLTTALPSRSPGSPQLFDRMGCLSLMPLEMMGRVQAQPSSVLFLGQRAARDQMSYCFVAWPLFPSFSFFFLAGHPERKASLTPMELTKNMPVREGSEILLHFGDNPPPWKLFRVTAVRLSCFGVYTGSEICQNSWKCIYLKWSISLYVSFTSIKLI